MSKTQFPHTHSLFAEWLFSLTRTGIEEVRFNPLLSNIKLYFFWNSIVRKATAWMENLLTASREHNDIKIRLYVQNVQFEVACSLHISVWKAETKENKYEN